jgi:hypothetical protein
LSQFSDTADRLVAFVNEGLTLTDACSRVGVAYDTARNWVSAGRRDQAGRYGAFAAALDAARASEPQRDDDREAGPVEREVDSFLRDRDLRDEARIAAAQARALARTVDGLASARGGSSGTALATVSRRLDECLASLDIQPTDALTELRERRAARLASA